VIGAVIDAIDALSATRHALCARAHRDSARGFI